MFMYIYPSLCLYIHTYIYTYIYIYIIYIYGRISDGENGDQSVDGTGYPKPKWLQTKKYSRSRLVYRPVLNFKTSALVPVIAVLKSYRISFHKWTSVWSLSWISGRQFYTVFGSARRPEEQDLFLSLPGRFHGGFLRQKNISYRTI